MKEYPCEALLEVEADLHCSTLNPQLPDVMPHPSPKSKTQGLNSGRLDELRSLQMSVDIRLAACGVTDCGNLRHKNEDNFLLLGGDLDRKISSGETLNGLVGPTGILLAVADGMGGNPAGDVASDLAVRSLVEEWVVRARQRPVEQAFRQAVEAVNERVWLAWQHNASWHGMATTLTAVLISGRTAYVVEVGDSRCYLVRQNQIKQVTKDQSVAELLVDSGQMSRAEAHQSPGNHIVLQALGREKSVEAAEISLDLRRNDWLILCSDGLYDQVTDEEIQAVTLAETDPQTVCTRLIALAKDRGAPDNVTVVAAQLFGAGLNWPGEQERVTSSLHMLHDYDPLGSGEITPNDLPQMLLTRQRRYVKAHTGLLVGYGVFLLLAVIFILYKALGF